MSDSSIPNASMRIVKSRRDYNKFVANETLEDYALGYTPHSFRKWSIFRVSNTALGPISFLVLEVIGATLAINYGFVNASWAIIAVSIIIFLTSLPISFYAAKYGLDMDLLTRGGGFWLHWVDNLILCLCNVHFYLVCARSCHYGLRFGALF